MTRSPLQRLQRDAYLTSRTAGDLSAYQRGGLPLLLKRIARRKLTAAAYRRWGR